MSHSILHDTDSSQQLDDCMNDKIDLRRRDMDGVSFVSWKSFLGSNFFTEALCAIERYINQGYNVPNMCYL